LFERSLNGGQGIDGHLILASLCPSYCLVAKACPRRKIKSVEAQKGSRREDRLSEVFTVELHVHLRLGEQRISQKSKNHSFGRVLSVGG